MVQMGQRRVEEKAVVLVGAGVASQRYEDPGEAVEALDLMRQAIDVAVADAGSAGLLDRLAWIGVPEGTWSYRDPGRLLAGERPVHTVVADVGILQQQLVAHAIDAVAGGAAVALVVGGEAKYRDLRATITGVEVGETTPPETTEPDTKLTPGSRLALGVSDLEIVRNTVSPVCAYALIEQAIGHALGRTVAEHRDHVAALWSRFAAVAKDNPHAWDRAGHDAAAIRDAGPGNRMISFPYTKRHASQWNVDQAAALFLCSVATARALGIAEDRWVFAHSSVVSNHAVPVSARADLHRSPGAEIAAPRALALSGITADDLAEVDLYSCFPSAVEVFAAALGLPLDDDDRPLTVTGGLTFAGGPLNNYVLQALVELADRLRAAPGSLGLSSSVSGFLVKQGFGVWSTSPPAAGYRAADVTAETAAATVERPVVDEAIGPATVASWTVDVVAGEPARAVAIVDLADGTRTIVESRDRDTADALLAHPDPIGLPVRIDGATLHL